MIWFALYLAVGILALGALGVIDEWIDDLRTHLDAESICTPIGGLLVWPLVVFDCFL